MTKSVYVHIPFCHSICSYCSFYRTARKEHEPWLEQMETTYAGKFPQTLETLYFGGGTPSSLTKEELTRLAGLFVTNEDTEWTIECNPEDITPDKLKTFKKLGINRISLGIQTFRDDMLQQMNRRHTAKQAIQAARDIQKEFDNWSLDLIYGLPRQTLSQLEQDLEQAIQLDPAHISIYSLQVDEDSLWHRQGIQEADPDLEADMYETIVQRLKEAGYEHYEISSFSKPGMESRHNLVYWQDKDYAAAGPGAAGREGQTRYKILPDFSRETETDPDLAFEAIMMGLRTRHGVNLKTYQQKYHINIEEKYAALLETYRQELEIKKGCLVCTERGFEILNTILVDFLERN